MTADDYLREIVEPTLKEFAANRLSGRHAFLASVATFHILDYLEGPARKPVLRAECRQESAAFAAVDRIAHGRDARLFDKADPSPVADREAARTVTPNSIPSSGKTDILELVNDAVEFLKHKIRIQPPASGENTSYTSFVVVPFGRAADGDLFPLPPQEVRTADVAARRARTLAAAHAGAIAFSRSGDAATGEAGEALVLAQFGEVDLEKLGR